MKAITLEDFVDSGIFNDKEEVINNALRHLTQAHPEYRIRLAIYHYQRRGISVGKAAEIAGVSFEQMKDILAQQAIKPRLGPENFAEAKEECESLQNYLKKDK